jgi:hypothetical protein
MNIITTGKSWMLAGMWLFASACYAVAGDFDSLQLGNRQDEQKHQVVITGEGSAENLSYIIGTCKESAMVRTFTGNGSGMSARFDIATSAQIDRQRPIVLEIEEIHDRRWQTFGYSVLVDGQEVYFRTYEEEAAGPNHYFVRVERALVKDPSRMTVSLVNRGAAPYSIARIWAYADFPTLADSEHIYQPMPVTNVGGEYQMPTGELGPEGYYAGGLYGDGIREEKTIDKALAAATGGRLSQLSLSAWYGSPPSGPDGGGGLLNDPKYSQICYRNGHYSPTFPNVWGNGVWQSMNAEPMNREEDRRRQVSCRMIRDKLTRLLMEGKRTPGFYIVSDLGPTYWNDADFGEFITDAARKEGITLNPVNLSWEAKLWMHDNLSRYMARIGRVFLDTLGRDPILVENGRLTLPQDQLSENLYSHPYIAYLPPTGDPRWRGWQTGVTDGMWVSGELQYQNRACYDYLTARGKFSMVNAEHGNKLPKVDWMVLAYQLGWQFFNIYSIGPNAAPAMSAIKGFADTPAIPPVHYERKLLDVRFREAQWLGTEKQLVDAVNTTIDSYGVKALKPDQPACLLYRIEKADNATATPITLFLEAKGLTGLEVAMGITPQDLATVATQEKLKLKWQNPVFWRNRGGAVTSIVLPPPPAKSSTWYLRLSWKNGILDRFRIGFPWERMTGQLEGLLPESSLMESAVDNLLWVTAHAERNVWTKREMRTFNLWIQQRAMTERLLAKYRAVGRDDSVSEQAAQLLRQCRYRSAYQALIGEYSQLLPATYIVRGHGQLGRYQIQAALPAATDTCQIKLHAAGPDIYDLELQGEKPVHCKVTLKALSEGQDYTVNSPLPGRYRIERTGAQTRLTASENKPLKVSAGGLSVDLEYAPPPPPKLKTRFSGMSCGLDGISKMIVVWTEDPTVNNGKLEFELERAPGGTMRRKNIGESGEPKVEQLKDGDQVDITVDEQGKYTSCLATYGMETGMIKSFEPPQLTISGHAGRITMESGNCYDLIWGRNHLCRIDTALLQVACPNSLSFETLTAGLQPGQEIEIRYCPYRFGTNPPRIAAIRQANTMIFHEDFKAPGDGWKTNAVATAGLVKGDFGYGPAIWPQNNKAPGYLTYHIKSDRPLGVTGVRCRGRAIITPENKIQVFTSLDNTTWRKEGEVTGVMLYNQHGIFFPLSVSLAGRNDFYLKFQLDGNGSWATLQEIEVRTSIPDAADKPNKQ